MGDRCGYRGQRSPEAGGLPRGDTRAGTECEELIAGGRQGEGGPDRGGG